LDVPIELVYPFGYGLSYTTFEYSDLNASQSTGGIVVSVEVTNTGKYTADEIVQCYIHDQVAKRVRPVKKHVDFSKVKLSVGQSKAVTFLISFEKLGYYDNNMNFRIDDGEIEILVGGCSEGCLSHSVDITYKKSDLEADE